MRRHIPSQSGMAVVALLVFMSMAITLATSAVMVTVANMQSTSRYSHGLEALTLAESGAEDALQRLLRNPSLLLTNEMNTIGNGTARITIMGTNPKTITVEGTRGTFKRTVQVTVSISGNAQTVTAWVEN